MNTSLKLKDYKAKEWLENLLLNNFGVYYEIVFIFLYFLFWFIFFICIWLFQSSHQKSGHVTKFIIQNLILQSIWQGPSIDDATKDWWKHDDVIEVVNILSDPILSEEEGTKIIEDFAKKYTYFGLIKKKNRSEN